MQLHHIEKGEEKEVVISKDDGIKETTTLEVLAKLKPAFRKGGSTTAGNSSQVSDGAAAVVLARRSVAQKLGMPILAKFVAYSVKGCDPLLMGIGPAVAIPDLINPKGGAIALGHPLGCTGTNFVT